VLQSELVRHQEHSCFKWCHAVTYAILSLTLGCTMVGNMPGVGPDGRITGGEPRLSALLELVSKGRPSHLEKASQAVSYVVSVYPARHMVLLEGKLPRTNRQVEATYSMLASLDSAESAEIAVITEIAVCQDGGESLHQRSEAFRWERGQWVVRSLAELQVVEPTP
jgi:hypothetical protein